ncbi:unnamed protein product [Nesidiocoris tenuis]|uniref:Uncharacterized protein n=1 Tax=Nesidiocoris tenuis TaxID=355587 RepID=A0A6H5GL49_9HEMI|nr:unnamed protein product [Nesidiocoris tenuis]
MYQEGRGGDKALASDGRFLYIHTHCGLFKMGTGYGETIEGFIYASKPDFFLNKIGWLGYAQDKLYFRLGRTGSDRGELLVIDRDTLEAKEVGKIEAPGVMFSDGENLGIVAPTKDDGFVVRTINPSSSPPSFISELPLKLARKCLVAFGYAAFDEETSLHPLNSGVEEETANIVSGKEFSLIRTTAGKVGCYFPSVQVLLALMFAIPCSETTIFWRFRQVYFTGKPSSLGMKQGGKGGTGKWTELAVPKSPKITHIAAGHDGLHAVLVAEDGSIYFTGTARRGEDGDHRRHPRSRDVRRHQDQLQRRRRPGRDLLDRPVRLRFDTRLGRNLSGRLVDIRVLHYLPSRHRAPLRTRMSHSSHDVQKRRFETRQIRHVLPIRLRREQFGHFRRQPVLPVLHSGGEMRHRGKGRFLRFGKCSRKSRGNRLLRMPRPRPEFSRIEDFRYRRSGRETRPSRKVDFRDQNRQPPVTNCSSLERQTGGGKFSKFFRTHRHRRRGAPGSQIVRCPQERRRLAGRYYFQSCIGQNGGFKMDVRFAEWWGRL